MDPPTSSGVKRRSSPPCTSSESSVKPAKLDLPKNQLDKINDELNLLVPAIISSILESDPSQINSFLSLILCSITDSLSTTIAKVTVLAPMTLGQAESIVQGFNSREHAEWVAGLWKGLDQRDWTDLITHRMS
jgi:hypothetical protein